MYKLKTPIVLLLILIISCKRTEKSSWNSNYTVPILNTSLSIEDISLSNITTDANGVIYLNYQDSFQLDNYDLFNIDNDTTYYDFNIPINSPVRVGPGTVLGSTDIEVNIPSKKVNLLEIDFKTGEITYKFENNFTENLLLTYSIANSNDKNGVSFNEQIVIPKAVNGLPSSINHKIILDGYTIGLQENPISTSTNTYRNSIIANIEIQVDPMGDSITISNTDSINVTAIISNVKPKGAKGNFGVNNITNINNTISFEEIEQIKNGNIDLEQVELNMEFDNYIGADIDLYFNEIKVKNDNDSLTSNSPLINQKISLGRAVNETTPISSTVNFTSNLSNLDEMFELNPNEIKVSNTININPNNDPTVKNDFINFDKLFNIDYNIVAPLSLKINNLTLLDTINYNAKNDGFSNLNALSLIINNGFPFSSNLQLYIIDENNLVVDSLISNQYIESGILLPDNQISPSLNKVFTDLSNEKIINLSKHNKLIIKNTINTTGANHVTLYDHYKVDIKLIGDINYEASID